MMAAVTAAVPPAVAPPVRPLERKFRGSTGISSYELEQKLGEGTFGEVYKARSKKSGGVVALKKILMHNEKDGFPITALREIKLLKMLSHINVIRLEEMAVERTKEGRKKATLYMVTPYMDHDLSGLLDNCDVHLQPSHIKCYMLQLLRGLKYLHNSHILHRDMKAANLLINNRGILKIADFGLARHYDEEVPKPGMGGGEAKRDYTSLVVTRWYRPPELLLQLRRYTTAIDMWGAGCVFGEMFKKKPILAGKSDINQAEIIFQLVGSPNDEQMPGWRDLPGCEGVKQWEKQSGNLGAVFGQYGEDAVSLLRQLLRLDWRNRINAIDALEHPYFKNHPLPSRPEDIPWFADSHELDRRNGRGPNQALPPAPAGGTVGGGPNGDWAGSGPPNGSWGSGGRGPRHPPSSNLPPGSNHPPGSTSQPLSRSYDSRVPSAAYDGRGPPPPPPRQQPWLTSGSRANHDALPVLPPHSLPRPPPEGLKHPLPAHPGHMARSSREPFVTRDSLHPSRDSREPRGVPRDPHRKVDVDSYVPSYSSGGGGPKRDDRHSIERDDRYSRRSSRDEGRDRDDRDRDHAGRERKRDYKRTRSRSPAFDDRDRDRTRERDRDADFYRR